MRKTNFILVPGIICLIFILAGCELVSNNDPADKNITYLESLAGGCNGQDFADLKSAVNEYPDTVILAIENDTLDLFVGLNYICCAPFTSNASASNDSITITLTDTCSNIYQNCYCRCMCYYTWDFLFSGIDEKDYYLKIILIDPREESPVIINEGQIGL